MTTHWHPSEISISKDVCAPRIEPEDLHPVLDGQYVWDQAPVLDGRGKLVSRQGFELWTCLSAPITEVAAARHEQARLRLLAREDRRWVDCGDLLPEGFSPGSREWAGMALVDEANAVTLFYTAAGTRGEHAPSCRQRILEASATLVAGETTPRMKNWIDRGEPIRADGRRYQVADEACGEPGELKAFRDPFYFRGPGGKEEYLLFSASSATAKTKKNGAIGIGARSPSGGRWVLQDPLIDCDGVTYEVERPQMVHHAGRYYLFWSAHGWTFADGLRAPTGLYGAVAESMLGPYEPMNGTGLVVANPIDRPYQAYSWFVSNDLSVVSFVDMLDGRIASGPGSTRYPIGTFEGTFAPEFRLRLNGAKAWIDRTPPR